MLRVFTIELAKKPYLSNPAFYRLVHENKAYGQLVLLGFDVTTFTPAAYQGRSLQPPL